MTLDDVPMEEISHDRMAWDDFFAGTLAGVALTLTGESSFTDTTVALSVWFTLRKRDSTERRILRTSVEREGRRWKRRWNLYCVCCLLLASLFGCVSAGMISSVYKGMGGPMLTVPLVNAIVFATYGQAKDVMHKANATKEEPLTLTQISLAGAYAGLMNSFIVSPVELVKTRLQIQHEQMSLLSSMTHLGRGRPPPVTVPSDPSLVFNGPIDCVIKILKQNGLKGLFRGMSATIYREIPGYASQFFAYEALKRALTRPGENVADLGAGPLIIAGGVAGIFGWCWSYPMDYIKSQIQSEPYDKKTPYKKNPYLFDGGFFSCWRQTVQKEGHRALWRGFGTCAARAFPANAAGFLAYEFGLDMIRNHWK